MRRLIVLAFLLPNLAQAAFLLEPYLGYQISSFGYENSETLDGTANGPVLGGRVGLSFPLLFVAVDASIMAGSLDQDNNSAEGDAGQGPLALVAGFDTLMLRGWAGYIFSDTFSFEPDNQSKREFQSGSGFKFGLGFQPLPIINLNAEYFSISYDEREINGNTLDLGNTSVGNMDNAGFLLSVSVPLEL